MSQYDKEPVVTNDDLYLVKEEPCTNSSYNNACDNCKALFQFNPIIYRSILDQCNHHKSTRSNTK